MAGLPFTLRQLEIFELLCDLRSFRLASEKLGISQASVSNQLKSLEQQLGLRLLAREPGRRPQLTADGAAFLADLGEFWRAADALAAHRRDQGEQEAKPLQLKLVVGNYLLKDNIRPKLDRFLERHPEIQLDFVSPTISETATDMVARGSFDLGLFHEPLDTPLGNDMTELARVRCGVFGNRSHLDGRNELLTAEQVSALPFLLPPAGTPYENMMLSMLARHGIKPNSIAGRTQYFDVMSAMFDRSNSVGIALEPVIRREHRNVVLLYRLEDWRLAFYRNPRLTDPRSGAVADFLISAVLDDPHFPALGASEIAGSGD
jgi:DNA-binding transcriptional LysR family regulator